MFCCTYESGFELEKGCTNPGHQVTIATQFYVTVPNICGSSVWNLPDVTLLVPRILRWLLHFWNIHAPLY